MAASRTLIYNVADGISIIYVKMRRYCDLWIPMLTITMNKYINAPADDRRLHAYLVPRRHSRNMKLIIESRAVKETLQY